MIYLDHAATSWPKPPEVIQAIANFLEYAVGQFGAGRLIYGSFQPVNDPLVPLGMVVDAEISDADKAMIAGGNLRAIVENVQK